jgi:outer membrane biosynthesis protein TonB
MFKVTVVIPLSLIAVAVISVGGSVLAQAVSPPEVVSTVVPAYSPLARTACVQGVVALVVEIAPAGDVSDIDVIYGHPLLIESAKAAASKWKFVSNRSGTRRRHVLRFYVSNSPMANIGKRNESCVHETC